MTTTTEIWDAAILLSVEERASLAERLLHSLDSETSSSTEIQAAWRDVVETRRVSLRAGEKSVVSWTEIQRNVRNHFAG